VAVVLGLLVAAAYGAADFFGGLSSKRSPVAAVVVLSQLIGLALVAVLVPIGGGRPTLHDLELGAAAGAFGGVGLVCLYRGLAIGRMSVVAPITAVGAAVVPVVWGLAARGERPSTASLVGVVVAVVAVGFISRSADEAVDGGVGPVASAATTLALAVVAGIGFGAVFVLLAETSADAGFWPLLGARASSITLLGLGALGTGRTLRPGGGGAGWLIVWAGLLDMTANAVYLLASRRGLLALVAVLSSLYPAGTVVLARIVLRERLVRVQLAGLAMALAGIVLIAAG
jgi:drug/metabolite transporter (DMT)-like permease